MPSKQARLSDPRPDYGIDAPAVIRNLFLVTAAGMLIWGIAVFGVWSGRFALPRAIAGIGFEVGVVCAFMGFWMLWESKIGKLRTRERLLDKIVWKGNEQVLDVGCGRGLMLIGAARRLPAGIAVGIDIWQSEDLSGNRPSAVVENARRDGVLERVHVQTADMRQMPFGDKTFDVVVSRAAIHNLYQASDRAGAIKEIARVLKPGGQAIIDDIRHHRQYERIFAQHGCVDVRHDRSLFIYLLCAAITFGSLRPETLIVRKS